MGQDLTNLNINATFQDLVQISGSLLTDGLGNTIDNLSITASHATTADASISASFSQTSVSSSHALVADVALNVPATASYALYAEVAGFATSSLSASHALVADLATTASYVENVVSASYAQTSTSASHAVSSDTAISSSHSEISDFAFTATSSSHANNSDTAISASHALVADTATSASHAIFADTAGAATDVNALYTASVVDATISFLKGGGGTFPITINNVANAVSASHAVNADSAISASYALTATSASFASSGNGIFSGSFSGSFEGDGSQLTGLGGGGEFQPATGASSSVSIYQPTGSITSAHSFMFSSGSTITANEGWNGIFAGRGNVISGGQGYGATIVGGFNNSITGNYAGGMIGTAASTLGAYNGFIGGGRTNTIASGDYTIIVGGDTNTASGNSNGVVGGGQNNASGARSVIVGGYQNTLNNTSQGIIAGGQSNTIDGGNDEGLFILNTSSGRVQINGGKSAGLVGGWNNKLYNFEGAANDIATGLSREVVGGIIFGNSNFIGAGTLGSPGNGRNGCPIIIGGMYNQIGKTTTNGGTFTKMSTILNSSASYVDSGSFQGVIGGYENYVSGSDNAYIIASNNSTIDSHNNSVIIGGSSLTTTQDNEVVVPNLNISGSLTDSDGNIGTAGQVLSSNGVDKVQWVAGGGGGSAFPYTGSAEISGSLRVNDRVFIGNNPTYAGAGSPFGIKDVLTLGANTIQVDAGVSTSQGFAIIGSGHTLQVKNDVGNRNMIFGGSGNQQRGLYADNTIIGGNANQINANSKNTIVGGFNNNINSGDNAFVVGSIGAVLNGGSFGGVVGGASHVVSAGSNNVIIGGSSNTLSHNNSVVIGGTSLSSTKTNEVVVPHLNISGSAISKVYTLTDVAGTTTMDCSLGNFFTLAMPAGGSTTLTPSNIQAGQTINVKITQNATPSTIAFASSVDFEGGTAFAVSTGAGDVDVMTFVSFDGTTLQATGLKNFS